ncbi:helicase-related protein [Thermobifida fusca]|uniref:helicase-related protein n=1 Tax=Thermobifida fusca TaxID=2021 RepID=UPI00156BC731|nr:helicase-related protein [Thermobifida fusca]
MSPAAAAAFAPGSLVAGRGREWVVLPSTEEDFVLVRPLNGDEAFTTLLYRDEVTPAEFPAPSTELSQIGDHVSASLLRTAMRVGCTSPALPLRCLGSIRVQPRRYQFVPLLLALRMETVRLLIADDVGTGKTVEAALIAKELVERGEARRMAVVCPPALAEQWQAELRDKFGIEAELVLPSTVRCLERPLRADQSVFKTYPYTIVSTDFITSEQRRAQFLTHCPDLVIVDEAHTWVNASPTRLRQQRQELLRNVAAQQDRHLILVTATPHSGRENAFHDLLGMLTPELAEADCRSRRGRALLARHCVRRHRRDIQRFLDQETVFPQGREFRDEKYEWSPAYAEFNAEVLAYAREAAADPSGTKLQQRVRWWSALALLRSVVSSPAAAAAALRTRSTTFSAARSAADVDALARESVYDADSAATEGGDAVPGAAVDPDTLPESTRRRLRALAERAEKLQGVEHDAKLRALIATVKGLLADGCDPVVFCRYIPTAHYVAEELRQALPKNCAVEAVTSELPPREREDRVAHLAATDRRRVLVATDCLSEGVNLHELFPAVVHYDMAWNPVRHEQREGRVDRFGQRAKRVRVVTLYGADNGIDGPVRDVLLRKHRTITAQAGGAVPVPTSSESVLQALAESLLLCGPHPQLGRTPGLAEASAVLHRERELVSEPAPHQGATFAPSTGDVPDVVEHLERLIPAIDDELGRPRDIASFVARVFTRLGVPVHADAGKLTVPPQSLPPGVRAALGVADTAHQDLVFRRDLPAGPHEHVLVRTDPAVRALARYVVETAFEPDPGTRPVVQRCGVTWTGRVTVRTVLLLVRYRFLLTLPGVDGPRTVVVEEARIRGYRAGAHGREWLTDAETAALVDTPPDADLPPELVQCHARRAVAELDEIRGDLAEWGVVRAEQLRHAHYGIRASAGSHGQGLALVPHGRADVVGVYVYLPLGDAP